VGHLTRRSLLGSAVAGGAALVVPRAFAQQPDGDVFEMPVRSGAAVRATRPFDLVAVEWEAPADVRIELRTRPGDGRWSAWQTAPSGAGHGPDRAPARLLSDPLWAGDAEYVELRSSRPLRGARLHFVKAAPAAHESAFRLAQPELAAGPGQPPIVARSSWATSACRPRHPPYYGTVDVAFVHHTAGSNYYSRSQSSAIVRSICLFHRNVHGWNDIGYNFLVDRYGRAFEGRAGGIDEPLAGAQAGGYNLASTGIAMIGTFAVVAPGGPAMDTLAHLLAWKLALHGIDAAGQTVVAVSPSGSVYSRYRAGSRVHLHRIAGHRDGDTTTCPGSALYRRLPSLRRRTTALQGALSSMSLQIVSGTMVSGQLTSDGQPVAGVPIEVQRRTKKGELTLANATTAADGTWSATPPLVHNAVLRALYRGTPGISAVVSPPLAITVPPQITLQVQAQQTTVGIPVVFSGTVAPAKDRVTLVVAQLQLDGTWTEVRQIRVAVENGSFSRGVAFSAPGQYQVTARTAGDATNAPGVSQPVAMTVA
jgi:hypothetical protein